MNKLSNLKNKLLVEETRDRIFRYILDSQMEIGTKLPNEFELAGKFDVGRSTIREAVKQLVSQGILQVKLALDLANVRIILEPAIAEMAALNATPEEVEKLYALCERVEKKIDHEDSYVEEDIAFHIEIAVCSKNMVMEQLIPIIDTAVMMFVNVTHKKLINETVMTHRAVVDAIAQKDPIGARSAMSMHMAFNRDLIKKMMKEEKRADE